MDKHTPLKKKAVPDKPNMPWLNDRQQIKKNKTQKET